MVGSSRTWKILAAGGAVLAGVFGWRAYEKAQDVSRRHREMEAMRGRLKEAKEEAQRFREQLERERAEPLHDLLKDDSPKVRRHALALLGVWKPEQVRGLLAGLLEREPDAAVLLTALDLAGKGKVKEAFPAILEKLASKDAAVRRKAAAVLGEMAEALSAGERERAGEAIAAAVERERAALGQAGRGSETGIFLPYIGALGKMKEFARAAPVLLKFLRSARHPMLRRSCALALQGVAEKAHEKALKAAWRAESDPMVRLAIEQILARDPFNLKVDRKRNVLLPKGP